MLEERLPSEETTDVAVACLIEDETNEEGDPPIVWINAKTTTLQLLAAEDQTKREKKTIDEVLPEAYKEF